MVIAIAYARIIDSVVSKQSRGFFAPIVRDVAKNTPITTPPGAIALFTL
ncbi:hypothetical protein [Chlorogloeopsis sp. ULAP02]